MSDDNRAPGNVPTIVRGLNALKIFPDREHLDAWVAKQRPSLGSFDGPAFPALRDVASQLDADDEAAGNLIDGLADKIADKVAARLVDATRQQTDER